MRALIGAAALAAGAGIAAGEIYTDATGDLFDNSFAHIDIASVEITNDADWLYITIQTAGDLDATPWGKYGVGINTGNGPSTPTNGWGRPIDWASQAITHWTATWADDGGSGFGGEVYSFDGNGWILDDATYQAGSLIQGSDAMHGAGIQMWQISLDWLGVNVGDTITFDVMTSGGGGGDPGVDHLSVSDGNLATPGWSSASTAGAFLSYTIVPTPGAAAMLGLGGLVAARRRR